MESPFHFGQVVDGESFTNRHTEARLLTNLLVSHNNAILISPRRYGKSSLVKMISNSIGAKPNFKFISLDLTASRSERAFLESFAHQVLKANSTKSIWKKLGDVLKTITPSFSLGMADFSDFATLAFNWSEQKRTTAEILNLPFLIAESTDTYQVIAIDEFQNISRFEDSEGLQYQLRAHWQHHTNVSYCLYGSKRHMMEEIFNSDSSPFYNFGQTIRLQKIEESHWLPFIKSQFESTKKPINLIYTKAIVKAMGNHSEYIQFFCHHVWTSVPEAREVEKSHVIRGFKLFMDATSMHFIDFFDKLNNTQVKLLRAILADEKQLTSQAVLKKYNLGTSANVVKAKRGLIEEDYIEKREMNFRLINPAFELWFRARIIEEPVLDLFEQDLEA